MTHLRRYLDQTGALPPEQLDAALRRQQIYGGSLDTVLLELEICDPHTLNELLAQACGLPIVPVELLDNGIDRPWDRVPEELVEIGWAVPLTDDKGQLWVGVHPDLPNERLGALYRSVPGVRPMVTPECCIEKIAAEHTRSVVPQRYAVLCVSYVSALRRRPSVSDVGFPILPDLLDEDSSAIVTDASPGEAHAYRRQDETLENRTTAIWQKAPPSPAPPPAPQASTEYRLAAHDQPPPIEESTTDTLVIDLPAPNEAIPEYVDPEGASVLSSPIRTTPAGNHAPPVRFTARGTMITTRESIESSFEQGEIVRRIAGARAVLASARTRDAAMDALVQAAMVISPRIALFRVQSHQLVGLSTPRSGLSDLRDRQVPLDSSSAAACVVNEGRFVGLAKDEALREAVGLRETLPCVMHRITVARRPVMVLYMDHGGREFLPTEAHLVAELCEVASETFEAVLKLRRAAAQAQGTSSTPPPPVSTQPIAASPPARNTTRPPTPMVATPARPRDTIAPPDAVNDDEPSGRITEEYGSKHEPTSTRWGPAPAQVRSALQRPPDDPESRARRRDTYIEGSASASASVPSPPPVEERKPILTVTAMPPPPPIPPPPPMAGDEDSGSGEHRRPDTLMGLPPPAQGSSGPRFIPPPLDERENSGIISLASPIHQGSARGLIELDEDDWTHPGKQLSNESDQRRIDAVLRAIAEGSSDVEDLREFGEPALLRLAAQFPGPLEVLRRDLRSLPPPSAHGPHIRTAIRLGAPMVPYLLDLLDHPGPDVRFYGAFVFQELRDPRCMRSLAELAFDASGDVRVIAMRVLETYGRLEGWHEAVDVVRAQLDSANRTRQLYAARAVGTLRDIEAIPKLIELLASSDRFIQEAALESLCSITGQQHGLKPHRWKSWFAEYGDRHRIEWIILSLRHRDAPVRRWAHDELIRVTGHRIPFSPMGDKSARDVAAQAWADWWESTGRTRLAPIPAGEYTG